MANYNFSTYIVEGKPETLQTLADTINAAAARAAKEHPENLNMLYVLQALDICGDDVDGIEEFLDNGMGIAGNWCDARIEERGGRKVMVLEEEYKWAACFNVETLAQLPQYAADITGVYFRSFLEGTDIYETNDDEGKYFPERYYLYAEWEDAEGEWQSVDGYFLDEDAIRAELQKHFPQIADDADLDQMKQAVHGDAMPDEDGDYDDDVVFWWVEVSGSSGIDARTVHRVVDSMKARF